MVLTLPSAPIPSRKLSRNRLPAVVVIVICLLLIFGSILFQARQGRRRTRMS